MLKRLMDIVLSALALLALTPGIRADSYPDQTRFRRPRIVPRRARGQKGHDVLLL